MAISNMVSKTLEYDDTVIYKATSSCLCCDMDIIMEIDMNELEVSLEKKIGVYSDSRFNWFKDKWERIVTAWEVLFSGVSERNGYFYFKDKEQVDSFVEALYEGMRKMQTRLDGNEKESDCDGSGDCEDCEHKH